MLWLSEWPHPFPSVWAPQRRAFRVVGSMFTPTLRFVLFTRFLLSLASLMWHLNFFIFLFVSLLCHEKNWRFCQSGLLFWTLLFQSHIRFCAPFSLLTLYFVSFMRFVWMFLGLFHRSLLWFTAVLLCLFVFPLPFVFLFSTCCFPLSSLDTFLRLSPSRQSLLSATMPVHSDSVLAADSRCGVLFRCMSR